MKRIYSLLSMLVLCISMMHAQHHWECNIYNFQYDMTVYVGLELNGVDIAASDDYEVAAFCGEECRGVAEVVTLPDQSQTYYYLRVRSNEQSGENISFKCYNKNTQEEIAVSPESGIQFESEASHGFPSSPVLLKDSWDALKGDINGDGVVDIQDVVAVIDLVLKGTYNSNADVNNDNVVDIQDVVAIIDLVLKA